MKLLPSRATSSIKLLISWTHIGTYDCIIIGAKKGEEEEKTLTLFLTTPEGVGAKEKLSQILSFAVVEQVFSRVGDDYSPPHYV